MATNVMRYLVDGRPRWGVRHGDLVEDLDLDAASTATLAEHADDVRDGGHRTGIERRVDSVELLTPVTRDRQFLCQAVNYRSHLRETGGDPAGSPFNVFFTKAPSSLAPAVTDIVCPTETEYLDHEVEIGLVLRRRVDGPRTIGDGDLADHVVGLVAVDDVSARDLQLAEGQFYAAKSFRTFGPVGPHITLVDADELARFDELRLRLWVDGDLRQDAHATDMVHRPAPSLQRLSAIQDWEPGDLVATGTPGGCALRVPAAPLRIAALAMSPARRHAALQRSGRRNPHRLVPGNTVEIHIATDDGAIDLGRQRTRVVAGA